MCITNSVQNIKIVMYLLCFLLNGKCFNSTKLSLSVYIIKKIARYLCMQGGVWHLDQRNWKTMVQAYKRMKMTEGGMHIHESLFYLVNQYIIQWVQTSRVSVWRTALEPYVEGFAWKDHYKVGIDEILDVEVNKNRRLCFHDGLLGLSGTSSLWIFGRP